jgi:hypothetical protein
MLVIVRITVQSDASPPVPLANVRWTITRTVGPATITLATGLTDELGATGDIHLMDALTYQLWLTKPYTTFTPHPVNLVIAPITDPQLFTFQGVYAAPPRPSGLNLCTLYGTLTHQDGCPLVGILVTAFNLYGVPNVDEWIVAGPTYDATTDTNGYFEIPLFRGSTVRLVIENTRVCVRFVVPDQEKVDLKDVLVTAVAEIQDVVEG